MTDQSAVPPGWYADGSDTSGGRMRWWDGAQWTDRVETPATDMEAALTATADSEPTKKAAWYRRKAVIIPAAVVVGLVVISGIAGGVNGGGNEADARPGSTGAADVVTESAKPTESAEPVDDRSEVPRLSGLTVGEARALVEGAGFALVSDQPDHAVIQSQDLVAGDKADAGAVVTVVAQVPLTLAQENALRSAQSYLSFTAFSREGLIQQLSSEYGEGYDLDTATWAADNAGADWNAEAVESAQSYLNLTSFSRDGLYEQLTSAYGAAFTPEQAAHALAAVGY